MTSLVRDIAGLLSMTVFFGAILTWAGVFTGAF